MLRNPMTLLVIAVALVLTLGPFGEAQQPAQAPPPWKQGQPSSMADSALAPIAQPPAPKAPGEITVDKIKVPAGFKVSLWAHTINNARVMRVRVWNDLGEVRLPLVVTDVIPRGVVCSLKGAWMATSDNGQTVSALCPADHADISEGACYNDARVEVAAL